MRFLRPLSGGAGSVRLEGRRVLLRPPTERDWRAYAEVRAASRKFLEPWEPTWPDDALTREAFHRRLRRYAADWRDDAGYSMFVFRRGDAAVIGGISLSNLRRGVAQSGSLGYWVGASHARQGYMTEVLPLMLEFCFERLQLHRVEAACLPNNEASKRLLIRCGFTEEGYARKYLKINGRWHDHILFAYLVDDFHRAAQAQQAAADD